MGASSQHAPQQALCSKTLHPSIKPLEMPRHPGPPHSKPHLLELERHSNPHQQGLLFGCLVLLSPSTELAQPLTLPFMMSCLPYLLKLGRHGDAHGLRLGCLVRLTQVDAAPPCAAALRQRAFHFVPRAGVGGGPAAGKRRN